MRILISFLALAVSALLGQSEQATIPECFQHLGISAADSN